MKLKIASLVLLAAVIAAPASAGISKKPNAQKVIAFMDLVFNQKKVKEGFDKYVGDQYIQHNPIAPDGPQAAVECLGHAPADEHENPGDVRGEHDEHRRDVPRRETETQAPAAPPLPHALSSRRVNPTPRTV